MQRKSFLFMIAVTILLVLVIITPALAQDGEDRPASNVPPLLLFTNYPSQVIGVEDTADLDLTLRTGTEAQVVNLSVEDLPESWTATFRGGEQLVRSAYVTPDAEATVRLRLQPPQNVEPGEYRFNVVAEGDGTQAELPIELIIQQRVPASLSWEVDLPTLRGGPDTTFSYNTTLQNEGGEELTVELSAETPSGFVTTFQSGGQEVTALPLAADESEQITIQIEPSTETQVGAYPLTVYASGGNAEATLDLTAEVVGQSSMSLTTPSGRLSGEAQAGMATTYTLLLQNTGSAPARNIEMTGSAPNGWEVTFEPQQIAEVAPGTQQEVTARVQPPWPQSPSGSSSLFSGASWPASSVS